MQFDRKLPTSCRNIYLNGCCLYIFNKNESIGPSEMPVNTCQATWPHNPYRTVFLKCPFRFFHKSPDTAATLRLRHVHISIKLHEFCCVYRKGNKSIANGHSVLYLKLQGQAHLMNVYETGLPLLVSWRCVSLSSGYRRRSVVGLLWPPSGFSSFSASLLGYNDMTWSWLL